jgi:hypothetical protein
MSVIEEPPYLRPEASFVAKYLGHKGQSARWDEIS